MKKFSVFAIALFVCSFVSCSESIEDDCSLEKLEYACDTRTGKIYAGSGKIYTPSSLNENMLEVGTISNGKVTIALPENFDSNFFAKLDPQSPIGSTIESQGVEALLYQTPLRLMDNSGRYVGDLRYQTVIMENELNEIEWHQILYWYFSKDAKIDIPIIIWETNTYKCYYDIDAKKGWNKIHLYYYIGTEQTICFTTDLSKVPDGLMWVVDRP